MFFTRQQLEEIEHKSLAPYGSRSKDSKGRAYLDNEPEYRTAFQRDRDRILHTTAFRRLEYKTQVFINYEGDYFRTRLTHTLEVAQIGRTLARALGGNEDLVESICLAHDLGHSPFGHSGEVVLARLMKDYGGFDHNRQSLRIVTELEQRYPEFPGLNLSWEVREGMVKHESEYDISDTRDFSPDLRGNLETQICNVADELAYTTHDLDDGLTAQLFSEKVLCREVKVWAEAARRVKKECGVLPDESRRYYIIRCIIDAQVRDVVATSEAAIRDAGVASADAVRRQPKPLVQYSRERRALNLELREYLYENLYFNREVHAPNRRAARLRSNLFNYYLEHRHELGEQARKRLRRAVADDGQGSFDQVPISGAPDLDGGAAGHLLGDLRIDTSDRACPGKGCDPGDPHESSFPIT